MNWSECGVTVFVCRCTRISFSFSFSGTDFIVYCVRVIGVVVAGCFFSLLSSTLDPHTTICQCTSIVRIRYSTIYIVTAFRPHFIWCFTRNLARVIETHSNDNYSQHFRHIFLFRSLVFIMNICPCATKHHLQSLPCISHS